MTPLAMPAKGSTCHNVINPRDLRLVQRGKALAHPYKGFWITADTVKERAQLEEMYHRGNCPWMVWNPERSGAARLAAPAVRASLCWP